MKLVVCYTHGTYEGTWQENFCVDYESKDHFLVAFIDALEDMEKAHDHWMTSAKALSNARASGNAQKINVAAKQYQDSCLDAHRGVVVDGLRFPDFEDYEVVDGKFNITRLPDVYELEEWFELNRPRQTKV